MFSGGEGVDLPGCFLEGLLQFCRSGIVGGDLSLALLLNLLARVRFKTGREFFFRQARGQSERAQGGEHQATGICLIAAQQLEGQTLGQTKCD